MLASVNPVLDPLLLTPLRNAVVNSACGSREERHPSGDCQEASRHDGNNPQQAQGERVAAPQQKHERPPQAQQKQERAPKGPPSNAGGGGKGKGKKR